MSFGEFWQQPNNRRFNLDTSKELNLSEVSKQLNVSENLLESVFTKYDTNKNGLLEADTAFENEAENFLNDVNATFSKKNKDNTVTTQYTDALGYEVTELRDPNGKLLQKTIILREGTSPLAPVTEQTDIKYDEDAAYTYLNGQLSLISANNLSISYTYKDDCVEITTPSETITVSKTEPDGSFKAENFIKKTFRNDNGEDVVVSKTKKGDITETVLKTNGELVTTFFRTDSVYVYEYFKNQPALKAGQILQTQDNQELFVKYDRNGNTITHAVNGESIDSLLKKGFFKDKNELLELNPKLKDKNYVLKVGEEIVIPGIKDITDEKIRKQGSVTGEYNKYVTAYNQKVKWEAVVNLENFRKEHLPNLDKEVFGKLNGIKGFELSQENIEMYAKINQLEKRVQKALINTIEKLSSQNKSTDDIKTIILKEGFSVPDEKQRGRKEFVNLSDGFTIELPVFYTPSTVKVGNFITNSKTELLFNPMEDGYTSHREKERYSVKNFLEKELGLDTSSGEGKQLYDQMQNLNDPYVILDINTMLTNIYRRTDSKYKESYDKAQRELSPGYQKTIMGNGIAQALADNPPLSKEQAKDMAKAVIQSLSAPKGTVVKTKYDNFINDHKDFYLRKFATEMVSFLYNKNGAIAESASENKSILNPVGKGTLAFIASRYSDDAQSIRALLTSDCYFGNKKLESTIKACTQNQAPDFDRNKIIKAMQAVEAYDNVATNPAHTEKELESAEKARDNALGEAFGHNLVHSVEELSMAASVVDGVTDLIVTIEGIGLVNKALGAGVQAVTKGTSLASSAEAVITGAKGMSWGQRLGSVAMGSASFAIFDDLKYNVDYFSSNIYQSQGISYGEGLGSTTLHALAFGGFASAWGQMSNYVILNKIFKTSKNELAMAETVGRVSKQFKNTSSFTGNELRASYQLNSSKVLSGSGNSGAQLSSFGAEVLGFSLFEAASKGLSGEFEGKDIPTILGEQFKTLLSFKAVGQILAMRKAGKLPHGVGIDAGKDIKIDRVKENGRESFKLTYPDGKSKTVENMRDVIALCNQHCENVTLYEPLEAVLEQDGKMELDGGIKILKDKSANKYAVEFENGEKVEGKDLKSVIVQAQNQHQMQVFDKTLQKKGEVELPGGMKITLDKETNTYKTTTENGKEFTGSSLEELFKNINKAETCERLSDELNKRGTVPVSNNCFIEKTEDGKFGIVIFFENGFALKTEVNSVEEAFEKLFEPQKEEKTQDTPANSEPKSNETTEETDKTAKVADMKPEQKESTSGIAAALPFPMLKSWVRKLTGGGKSEKTEEKSELRPATKEDLEKLANQISKIEDDASFSRKILLKIAELDIDVAKILINRGYYFYISADNAACIIEAMQIDKNTTIKLLNITYKQGVMDKLFKVKPDQVIPHLKDILDIVKSAQENYELTMEIVNFAKENHLNTFQTIPNVVKLATVDKDLALKLYKQNNSIDYYDAVNYINALNLNREQTLTLIGIKDKYNNYLLPHQIYRIVYATTKSTDFMNSMYDKVIKKEISIYDYDDIAIAVNMLGGDFAYKTVDELTPAQKRILLNEISSWKHSTGRREIIDEMFPCLPNQNNHVAIVNLINRLTRELNSKPETVSNEKIAKFNTGMEQLFIKADKDDIKSLVEEHFPEYKDIIDDRILSNAENMINRIVKNKEFTQLSDNDKKITVLSSILSNFKRVGETQNDTASDAYNSALKLGFDEYDAEKIYSIVKSANLIEQFMSTTKDNVHHLYENEYNITNREAVFNQLAFQLKEGNTFDLAKLVYTSVEQEGLTRFLDNLLKNRINEMKADDFVLYQTPIEEYKSKAHKETLIGASGKSYDVMVLNSDEIDNFYAIGHNADGISGLKGNRPAEQRFAKLKTLEHVTNDRAYCGFYIDGENICAIGNGFIFVVPNDKFYVGTGHDIGSAGKTVQEILDEYFITNDVVGKTRDFSGAKETKNEERQMVSRNLKEILGISDEEYIRRLDNIKSQLRGRPFTPENVQAIDSEFANAYKEFLSRVNHDGTKGKEALLSDGEWNEVIVSNPKIGGIYTTNLATISEDMLIFAKENDLPIIVLKPRTNIPEVSTKGSELSDKARTENPAVVAEAKVREEWQQHDLDTGVKEVEADEVETPARKNIKIEAGNELTDDEQVIASRLSKMLSNNKTPILIKFDHVTTDLKGKPIKEPEKNAASMINGKIVINRVFLENVDSRIADNIENCLKEHSIYIDTNGQYRVSSHLKNEYTAKIEEKLNSYQALSLADKFDFCTSEIAYLKNLTHQTTKYPHIAIEAILKNENNVKLLKSKNLYKDIDEISSMSGAKQSEYLKQITKFVKIPDDIVLKPYPGIVFVHENGHKEHYEMTTPEQKEILADIMTGIVFTFPNIQEIAAKVSARACENPKEFVAEVYSGLKNKQIFPKDVMDLYEKYYGPKVEETNPKSDLSSSDAEQIIKPNKKLYSHEEDIGSIESLRKKTVVFPDITEEVWNNISRELVMLKEQHGIEPDGVLRQNYLPQYTAASQQHGDDIHLRLSDNNGLVFKFNKQTGKLISVTNNDKTIHFNADGTIDKYAEVNIYDGEHSIDYSVPLDEKTVLDFKIYDSKGNEITYEKYVRQVEQQIPGQYQIYSIEPTGKKYIVGLLEIMPDGGKNIEQNLHSLDGTKTDFIYQDDNNGNRILYKKITSPDGKVQFETKKTFKVLSKNHFQTSTDGEYYDILITDNKVQVTKLDSNKNPTNEITEYDIIDLSGTKIDWDKEYECEDARTDDIFKQLGIQEHKFVIDKRVLSTFDRFAGDEWFKLAQSGARLLYGDCDKKKNAINSVSIIGISKELYGDTSTAEHETGHSVFNLLDLSSCTELWEIYQAEKEEISAIFPDCALKLISYMLKGNENNKRGLNELVAETNLMNSIPQENETFSLRTILLQKYFPKTIAYISNKINHLNSADIKIKDDKAQSVINNHIYVNEKPESSTELSESATNKRDGLDEVFKTMREMVEEYKADLTNAASNENLVKIQKLTNAIEEYLKTVTREDLKAATQGLLETSRDLYNLTAKSVENMNALKENGIILDFETMTEEDARKALREVLPEAHKDGYREDTINRIIDGMIEAAKIKGKISKHLVEKWAEMEEKSPDKYVYRVENYVKLFKCEYGIDTNAEKAFNEMLAQGKSFDFAEHIIEICRGESNVFQRKYYDKLMSLTNLDRFGNVIQTCMVNGEFDETLWQKVVELDKLGFETSTVEGLIELCRKNPDKDKKELVDFRQKTYDKILDMINNHGFSTKNVLDILLYCEKNGVTEENGVIDENAYQIAVELKSHIEEKIICYSIFKIKSSENKEEAYKYIDELINKYGADSRTAMFLWGVVCGEKSFSKKKDTLRFNENRYNKLTELISKHKIEPTDAGDIIKSFTVNGELDMRLYVKFTEYKEHGMADCYNSPTHLAELLESCIKYVYDENGKYAKDADGKPVKIVDYNMLDKIKDWYDAVVNPIEEFGILKGDDKINYIYTFMQELKDTISFIQSKDSDAVDYIGKFINSGITNICKILNSAVMLGDDGYYHEPRQFDTNIMDKVLNLVEKYELNNEDVRKVLYVAANTWNRPSSEARLSSLDYVDRLLKAGWKKENIDLMEKLMKECEFIPEKVDLYEEAVLKGIDESNISELMFHCRKNENEYFDIDKNFDRDKFHKAVDILKICPKEKQKEYVVWSTLYTDWAKEIEDCINAGLDFETVFELFRYEVGNKWALDPVNKEHVADIFEVLKNNPDKTEEITKRLRKSIRYFGHLDKDINEIFNNIQYNTYATSEDFVKTEKLMKLLDSPDADFKTMGTWAFSIARNCNNIDDICPELIEKIKEFSKTGELKDHIYLFTKQNFINWKNPEFVYVLDALAKAEKDGIFILGLSLLETIKTNKNIKGFHSNYQEIIDFYRDNIKFLTKMNGSSDPDIFLQADVILRFEIFQNNASIKQNIQQPANKLPETTELDVTTMRKVTEYMQTMNNAGRAFAKIAGNVDLKNVVDFLDKVNMEEYKTEVEKLFEQIGKSNYYYNVYDAVFNSNLEEREINFVLDIQKTQREAVEAHNEEIRDNMYSNKQDNYTYWQEPNVLDGNFYGLFAGKKYSDEVLNKIRFYIENRISIDGQLPKSDELKSMMNVYQNYPEKTEEVENYYFRKTTVADITRDYYMSFLSCISQDKEISDIQFEIFDDIMSYKCLKKVWDTHDYGTKSNSNVREIRILFYNRTPEDIKAIHEIWNLLKPQDKNIKNFDFNPIFSILLKVKNYNIEIIKEGIKQGYKLDEIIYIIEDLKPLLANKVLNSIKNNEPVLNIKIASRKADSEKVFDSAINIIHEAINKGYKSETIQEFIRDLQPDLADNVLDLIKNNESQKTVILAANAGDKLKFEYALRLSKDGRYFENDAEYKLLPGTLCSITVLNQHIADLMLFNTNEKFDLQQIISILNATRENETRYLIATEFIFDKSFPRDRIANAISCYQEGIHTGSYVETYKRLIKTGFNDLYINRIMRADSDIMEKFTTNFCKVLLHLQNMNADPGVCADFLLSDKVSYDITENVKMIEIFNMLDDEDFRLLALDGVDINKRIKQLQDAVDVKYPIIETDKESARGIFRALSNKKEADEALRRMDLSPFEKTGIPLEYSRNEFTQNMNRLIMRYSSASDSEQPVVRYIQGEKADVKPLELSQKAQTRVEQEIERYKREYETTEAELNIDGKICKGVKFEGSHRNGSNPGEYYLMDGKLYYIKFPYEQNLGQSIEEVLASQLYRAAGIDAPNEYYVYDGNGKVIGMASEYIPDAEKRNWDSSPQYEVKRMFDSYAVDAWLANKDAPKNDNTKIYDDGKIIKIDVGGSMHYRAQGEIKEDFDNTVSYLRTLLQYNNFYRTMTKQDLLNSIKRVTDIPDETIAQIILSSPVPDVKLLETMLKRKEYMKKFAENLEQIDDTGLPILDVIIQAEAKTTPEFRETPDIAGAFGYSPAPHGFEGLLNNQDPKLNLTAGEKEIADQMKQEITRFTTGNRLADNAPVTEEVRNFINGILQGIPEFAGYFGKYQHANSNAGAEVQQGSGHQYTLDIHILKVLQKSVQNPLYDEVDEYGYPLLDNESKTVLKFAALLHDIGKRTLYGKDETHSERSADYVYSLLDRFNLPARVKDRIINLIDNHHWFEALCTGTINEEGVASLFRTTADFTIARIMAQADLESVYDGYFTVRMHKNFPSEVNNSQEAKIKFDAMMKSIQEKVNHIEDYAPVVQPSRFKECMGYVDGKYVRRGFPEVTIELDGKQEKFKILNLNDYDPDTDMFQFGFGHIKLKDLRLLVHRFGDYEMAKFRSVQLLGKNAKTRSLQSYSFINIDDASAYCNERYAVVIEGNIDNIGVADYANANTGGRKGQLTLIEELFDASKATEAEAYGKFGHNYQPHYTYKDPNSKHRIFFRNAFTEYMKEKKGIDVTDVMYRAIIRYVRKKQYIESQMKDLKIGNVVIKKQDLVDGLLFAQDELINIKEKKYNGYHNEITQMAGKVVAGGADVGSQKTEDILKNDGGFNSVLNEEFLRNCRDYCGGTIILWSNDGR